MSRARTLASPHYIGKRYPARLQLALEAARYGFRVINTHAPRDGWNYMRIFFDGMGVKGQSTAEFIARYRPFENVDSTIGVGFQVFATCTTPNTIVPSNRIYVPSGVSVSTLWNVIKSGQPPVSASERTSSAYLDGLYHVQIGGPRYEDVPVPNNSNQKMQNPLWISNLNGLIPRT
jgi:hypothetical protein